MIDQAPRQVAVKVSPEGDRLITSGAHYLHMSKKDLVEAAVTFYLDARREETQAECASCCPILTAAGPPASRCWPT